MSCRTDAPWHKTILFNHVLLADAKAILVYLCDLLPWDMMAEVFATFFLNFQCLGFGILGHHDLVSSVSTCWRHGKIIKRCLDPLQQGKKLYTYLLLLTQILLNAAALC